MLYEFKATPEFWKSYNRLSESQKKAAKAASKVFKANPFDPSLRPHKINRLTALFKRPVISVTADNDLRSLFVTEGNKIISIEIGTHDIYK